MRKDIDWIKAAMLLGMGLCGYYLLLQWGEFQSAREALALEQNQQMLEIPYSGTESASLPLQDNRPAISTETANSTDSRSIAPVDSINRENTGDDFFPEALTVTNTPVEQPDSASTNLILVQTPVFDIQIDPVGGDFVSAGLRKHQTTKKNEAPFQLLRQSPSQTYVARSGLLGRNGTDFGSKRPVFSSSQTEYKLTEGSDPLEIDLSYQQGQVKIIKRFRFRPDDYLVDVEYLIENNSEQNWQAAFYAQIKRDDSKPDSGFGLNPYVGAAITLPDERYKKVDFEDLEDGRIQKNADSGWVAMLERYFLTAWIPQDGMSVYYDLQKSPSQNIYYAGFTQPEVVVEAGDRGRISTGFYVGPKNQYQLREIAPYLDLTVDYGWLWWAAQPIYAVLYFVQSGQINSFGINSDVFGGFGNWGISIILLTVIVKLIFFPLSAASYKSMARMRKLTPKMAELKERFGDDRQAMSQEMMKLYQKEKVNPMGGCLPILVQMPIFLALYWVLLESVEIRHAPFIGWLQDLSAQDPFYILPLIMGAAMWFQQKLNPPPPDPTQAKVMQFMPIMFTAMFLFFPSGLVLYWTVNQLLSIAQQWVITQQIESGKIT